MTSPVPWGVVLWVTGLQQGSDGQDPCAWGGFGLGGELGHMGRIAWQRYRTLTFMTISAWGGGWSLYASRRESLPLGLRIGFQSGAGYNLGRDSNMYKQQDQPPSGGGPSLGHQPEQELPHLSNLSRVGDKVHGLLMKRWTLVTVPSFGHLEAPQGASFHPHQHLYMVGPLCSGQVV